MNDQTLDAAAAISINGVSLILIKDITKLFGTEQVKFQISIKDNKLILESQEISKDLEIQESIPVQETVNVY